jgi:excisionase family DNA binding protein
MTKRQARKIETEYLSICEYADMIGVHSETIRRMIKDGRITAVRVGRIWRIRKDEMPKVTPKAPDSPSASDE